MKYLLIFLILALNAIAYDAFITPFELKNSLENSNLLLFDVSSDSSYKESHISGAIHVDISKFIKSAHARMNVNFTQKVQKELMNLGINENSDVVIYSRNNVADLSNSTYFAFILIQHGFNNVTILNGGYMAWAFTYHNFISTQESHPLKKGTFNIDKNKDFIVTDKYLKEKRSDITLIDSTEILEHNNTVTSNKIGVKDNFFDDLTLRSDLALRESFIDKLDLKSDKEIVIFSDTIFSASINWYILYKKFGFKNTKIYDGTFK